MGAVTATQEQFEKLWSNLALSPAAECYTTWRGIEANYTDPRRAYHTLDHIGWGLNRIDEMQSCRDGTNGYGLTLLDWNAIRWAWWFHDYVMNEDSGNEDMSADEASERALRGGASVDMCEQVDRLVLATSHGFIPLRIDEAVICDVDLSILGAEPRAFDAYERQVRREYQEVPENLFRSARHEVMRPFYDRPWVYLTDYARNRWEEQAKENLGRSLARLRDVA